MADRGYSKDFKTPPCRLGFSKYLLAPEKKVTQSGPNKGKEFEEYGATLIFPTSTPKTVFEAAVVEAALDAKWGKTAADIADLVKKGLIKSPFLLGDGKEARSKKTGELHPGMGPDVWFIRTNTRRAPLVRYKNPNVQATAEEVYSGCYGFAALNAYTWTGETGKGVTFGLQFFQKKTDGERLGGGGGIDIDDYYEKIEDVGDAPAETQNGAGAAGLFG